MVAGQDRIRQLNPENKLHPMAGETSFLSVLVQYVGFQRALRGGSGVYTEPGGNFCKCIGRN